MWRNEVQVGSSYNHLWLWTDPDTGAPKGWVSAYYLKYWRNHVAKDNSSHAIPDCL